MNLLKNNKTLYENVVESLPDPPPPTICLNMIVKNESKIITRLLDSVISIIDFYCICDTGSTDNTCEIITEYFKNINCENMNEKIITGKIIHEPFINFEYNRNFALKSCLNMSDFVLFADADMQLEVKDFDKSKLNNYDVAHILQGNDDFNYNNIRIIKNTGDFKYIGVTHEYLSTPDNCKVYHFDKSELFYIDYYDGGSKTDKYERDIKLLIDGIEKEPNNARYYFYIANSYYDVGNFEKAIEKYEKRIELGGWNQEIWYSYYKIGLCYKNLNKIDNAICSWMYGYEVLPERIENIYEIIKHYRIISKHKLCMLFYKIALPNLKINNRNTFLFLHEDVYKYKLYYEYTIFSNYTGNKNINNEVIKILNNSNDYSISKQLIYNLKFFKFILQPSNIINFNNNLQEIYDKDNIMLVSSSCCLLENKNSDGYIMNMRYVNYNINKEGLYLNCEKNSISYNKFLKLDSDFHIVEEKMFKNKIYNKKIVGIEDVRIYHDVESNKILFIGSGSHENDNIGIFKGVYNVNNQYLDTKEIKCSFTNNVCEKNWVYFEYKEQTHVIYKWEPLEIAKINKETNMLDLVVRKKMPKLFSYVRGSSCGYKLLNKKNMYKEEIWFIVNLISFEKPRCYYHLIIVFNKDMDLLRYTAPFKFTEEPIEYSISLIVEEERVLITYSVWDRESKIGIYDRNYIDSLLIYDV
jgi:tetratricopeptide (TPR) repeat protein